MVLLVSFSYKLLFEKVITIRWIEIIEIQEEGSIYRNGELAEVYTGNISSMPKRKTNID